MNEGVSTFGIWQAINIVLYIGIDAPWNKVQHWPVWNWYNLYSVFFPTVLGLTVSAVLLMAAALIKALF